MSSFLLKKLDIMTIVLMTTANLLGLSTQNAVRGEFATAAASVSRFDFGKLHTLRYAKAWQAK